MAPILLDSRSLLKFSAFVLTGMIVTFAGGYLIGYEAAVGRPDRVTVPVAMLPEPAHAEPAAYQPQVPEIIEPGLHIDVDLPDPSAEPDSQAVTTTAVAAKDQEMQDAPAQASDFDSEHQEPLQVALLDLSADVATDAVTLPVMLENDEPAEEADSGLQLAVVDTATPETARYSVQVGMFADRANAERNLRELESIDLSAWLDEYTNSSEETRFNVRFGWFGSKADALAALSVYENTHGGAGYVVYLQRKKPGNP